MFIILLCTIFKILISFPPFEIVVNCHLNSTFIYFLLDLITKLFNFITMTLKKVVLLALFFQIIIEVQDVLVLGLQIDFAFMFTHFVSGQPLFFFVKTNAIETMCLKK